MSVCEQTRVERIPLIDGVPAEGGSGGESEGEGEGEQDCAVVMHVLQSVVPAGPGRAAPAPVSRPDVGTGRGSLTGVAGEPGADLDDDTGVVRSVN
jgi:hypothetical protein